MISECFAAKGGPDWVHERWALLIAKRVRALSIDKNRAEHWEPTSSYFISFFFRFYEIFKVDLLEQHYEEATPGDLLERYKSGGQ